MSSFVGSPAERLSLPRAVDALADAARRAGRPSLVWFVGILYPSLNLNLDLVRGVLALVREASGIDLPWAGERGGVATLFAPGLPGVSVVGDGAGEVARLFLYLPLFLISYRLIVGLVKVSDPLHVPKNPEMVPTGSTGVQAARGERLRTIWAEGRGLGMMALCLWAMLLALLLGAMLVLIGPVLALLKVLGLASVSPLVFGLLAPVLFLILAYAAVLMVLNQLALHSLAHNNRGVASALTHAWRLVRASPMSALRATLVDFALFLALLLTGVMISDVLLAPSVFEGLSSLIVLALYGFVGVTRAGFWARTYRALGGLSSVDRVPGL